MIKNVNDVNENHVGRALSPLEKIKQSKLEFYSVGQEFYIDLFQPNAFAMNQMPPSLTYGLYGMARNMGLFTQHSDGKPVSPVVASLVPNHIASTTLQFYVDDTEASHNELMCMGFHQTHPKVWMANNSVNVIVRMVNDAKTVVDTHARIKELLVKHMAQGNMLDVVNCLYEALTNPKGK